MKKNVWNLTQEQVRILNNCAKINPIIKFSSDINGIVSTNRLDKSFTLLYVNKTFNYDNEKTFVIHNLTEILKTVKMIGKGIVYLEDDKIIITDEEETVKSKYIYGSETLVSNIDKFYKNYETAIAGIKNNEGTIKAEINLNHFELIKKFQSASFNTLSFNEDKVTLFDNTGFNNDLNTRDTTEVKLLDKPIFTSRFDIDFASFKLIEEGNYDAYFSPSGFIIFEEKENGNIYGIAINILDK